MASFVKSVAGEGIRAILGDGEHVFVGLGITVASTTDTAITSEVGPSSSHVATIGGHLIGAYNGIVLGNNGGDHDQSLQVWKGGEVRGVIESGAEIHGDHSTVNNAGLIHGGIKGISFAGGGDGASSIINSGVIEGGMVGIESLNTSSGVFTVNNSGTIKGSALSFNEQGYSGSDVVKNTGSMVGGVSFGSGADIYDGRHGHVTGSVSGGGGNDKLYGGSENNHISGGDGNDFLFGGKGNDTFYFNAAPDASTNVDRIGDFANKHGDNDHITLDGTYFDNIATGTLSSDAFYLGTKAADAEDRIIYDQKTGNLYFDHDGKGGDAEIKFAHLDNHAALTHADFSVLSGLAEALL